MADDDCAICEKAMEIYFDLKVLKDKITKTEDSKDKQYNEHMSEMQAEIKNIATTQLKQQQELLERQKKKEQESKAFVKLPKIEIRSFDGDKLKWLEFWDSFQCTVHENKSLSEIQKFNYLRSKVTGEALRAISGLALSNDNYRVAVGVLHERFGNKQQVVDLHYNKLINLRSASSNAGSLRSFLDTVETHLRSLEVLGQDVDQDVFISMIRSRLPEDVLIQLEIMKGSEKKMENKFFTRHKLREYVTARERAEKKPTHHDERQRPTQVNTPPWKCSRPQSFQSYRRPLGTPSSSAEALTATIKHRRPSSTSTDYFNLCRYCEKKHFSDECPQYRGVADRKKKLKDSCYKCLKLGHKSNECKKGKVCVHCGETNSHHRSLCPSKFKEPITSSVPVHLIEEIGQAEIAETIERAPENALISSGEIVLMQTASTEVKNPSNEARSRVRLLLDSGSQRSYISADLAKKLKLKHDGVEEISVMTFGCDTSKKVKTKISHIDLKLKNGDYIPVSVNIVPVISGVIQRKPVNHLCESAVDLLKTVDLADTLTTECEETHIDLQLGNDYYLDLVLCQKLEIQKGLYLLSSKLGWILTGRTNEEAVDKNDTTMLILTYGQNITNSAVFTNTDQTLPISHELEDFWTVESIGVNDKPGLTGDEKAVSTFTETLKFSDGRYQVSWPWKDDIPDLPVNRELALGRLKSTLGRLNKNPEILKQYDSVIQDQLKKGIVEKVDKSKKSELRHYIPHHAVVTP